jgi:RNA polymerase sigma-70 factor (ECF subfamily)
MPSDSDLYRRWLDARDERAFADLARRHATLVFDVAWRTGGDPHLAEDALQEALLRLATDGTDRPVQVGVRAWLARLAISKALNTRASSRARAKREHGAGARRAEVGMTDDRASACEEVAAALAGCKRDDAALLSLRYLHGLAYAEVAAVLGVAEPTARVRVHRARRRVRRSLGRDGIDERALAGLIAAVPPYTPSDGAVESAVAGAVSGTTAAALRSTVSAVAPWIPRALAIAGLSLLVVGSAGLLWWAAVAGRSGEHPPAAERAAAPRADKETTLRGRPAPDGRPASSETSSEGNASLPPAPEKAPPEVGTTTARPRDDGRVPLRARLLLVLEDGTEEVLPIEDVRSRGTTWPGASLVEHPDAVRVRAGAYVGLSTFDARAAIRHVLARVPDPPSELVIRIPARGTIEDALALEVVDAGSGLPLPDAWLEWGSGEGAGRRVPADRHGRIPVRIPDDARWADADEPVLWRFGQAEWIVHAPGYRAEGTTRGVKEYAPSVLAEDLETWRSRGVRRIALRPWPEDGSVRELRVRLLHADGRPAAGVYVLVSWPVRREPLWGPRDDGFRRADEDGGVTIPVHRVVGLDVRIHHVPVAAWGLAEAAWPVSGPRVLRLPPLAEAELVVEGVPEDATSWTRDLLGPRRTPHDGPSFDATYDPEATALLQEHDAVLFSIAGDMAQGSLASPRATIRLPLAVGKASTLHLYSGREHRTWTVRATEPGPLRETRSWKDLPKAE